MKPTRPNLHKTTHKLCWALLNAAIQASQVHGHFLSGEDDQGRSLLSTLQAHLADATDASHNLVSMAYDNNLPLPLAPGQLKRALDLSLSALNEIPNRRIKSRKTTTYAVASEIEQILKQIDGEMT